MTDQHHYGFTLRDGKFGYKNTNNINPWMDAIFLSKQIIELLQKNETRAIGIDSIIIIGEVNDVHNDFLHL